MNVVAIGIFMSKTNATSKIFCSGEQTDIIT